uniref:hypothetical protein n=1 Tax=Acetatifactor sp. TaxID=1872090 RepID=UPI0040565A61
MKDNKKANNSDGKQTYFMPISMCLGMSLGTAIGVATDNLSMCMSLGVAFGLAIGSLIDARNRSKFEDSEKSSEENE